MSQTGICPKCGALVDRLVITRIEAGEELGGSTYSAMTLLCPHCRVVLGTQLARMFDDAGTRPRGVEERQDPTSH